MGKKQKSAADIKAQITKLKDELKAKERAECERIGREMRRRTGKESWEEIAAVLDVKRARSDVV